MDIARCQFCDIKFSHRITEALDSFDYEIHNSVQITFHLAHKWSKWFVSKFSEIMLYTWYFCNLHMIKRKRDNGISIADKAEILIPLLCSKTSICKHYYQSPLQRRRERMPLLPQAIKYCWYGAKQAGSPMPMQWRCYNLALSHWYIPGNTCTIIMQFIHIVQVEILFLPLFVHHFKKDIFIFIPEVF